MTMDEARQVDVLVLRTEDGGYYTLSRGQLERYRASPENAALIDAMLIDEVEGFGLRSKAAAIVVAVVKAYEKAGANEFYFPAGPMQ